MLRSGFSERSFATDNGCWKKDAEALRTDSGMLGENAEALRANPDDETKKFAGNKKNGIFAVAKGADCIRNFTRFQASARTHRGVAQSG